MQTSTSNSIVKFITDGKPPVSKADIFPAQWVEIILGTVREMKGYLRTSLLFRKLTEPLFHCGGVCASDWLYWGETGNQKSRNEALSRASLPKGITLDTKAVCLWQPWVGYRPSLYTDILLTDQGALLMLERWSEESGPKECVKEITMKFWHAEYMQNLFAFDADAGKRLFFLLHILAKTNAKLANHEAKQARKLKKALAAKLALID